MIAKICKKYNVHKYTFDYYKYKFIYFSSINLKNSVTLRNMASNSIILYTFKNNCNDFMLKKKRFLTFKKRTFKISHCELVKHFTHNFVFKKIKLE